MIDPMESDIQMLGDGDVFGSTPNEQDAESQLTAAILDTVDALIVVFDRNGRITRFNRACEKLTGYTFEEVNGQMFWDLFILPDEKPIAKTTFSRMLTCKFPEKINSFWRTKDGRRRLIAWSYTAHRDVSDRVSYIISAGKDITEREQTALLMNASESLQRVTTALLQHLTTLDDVLSIVCVEACRLTEAGGSAVLLLEDETNLQVKSSCGTPLPVFERLSVDDSFAGMVVQQKEPLLVNDPQNYLQAYQRNPAVQALLAVPLCVEGTILGVLNVINKHGGFTEADMRLMRLFADQAAISIEHAQLHQQAAKLAVMEERQRLARELHDSVTQAIYSVTLYADAARMALAAGKQELAANHMQELRNMAREAMLDMRLLIFELHPPVLEKEGLAVAVQTRLETVEARSGLQSTFQVDGVERRFPIEIEEDLYRIVQEALNNAVKHAKSQKVAVHLSYDEMHFSMKVSDDGIGFDPNEVGKGASRPRLGLIGMQERAEMLGGSLVVQSASGAGTSVQVRIPLEMEITT